MKTPTGRATAREIDKIIHSFWGKKKKGMLNLILVSFALGLSENIIKPTHSAFKNDFFH